MRNLQELPERKSGAMLLRIVERSNFYARRCAMTTDPVCGMKVDDKNSQYQTQYGDKTVHRSVRQQCKNEFEQNPEQYARSAA